jgi:hypothetical protein
VVQKGPDLHVTLGFVDTNGWDKGNKGDISCPGLDDGICLQEKAVAGYMTPWEG